MKFVSTRNSALVAVLFTCWPPGPGLHEKLHVSESGCTHARRPNTIALGDCSGSCACGVSMASRYPFCKQVKFKNKQGQPYGRPCGVAKNESHLASTTAYKRGQTKKRSSARRWHHAKVQVVNRGIMPGIEREHLHNQFRNGNG